MILKFFIVLCMFVNCIYMYYEMWKILLFYLIVIVFLIFKLVLKKLDNLNLD